jgi:hypothetical protein
MDPTERSPQIVASYLALRRNIGMSGILLPVILAIGWIVMEGRANLQPSISSYYATGMRNVFVGILFAAGLFLFTYHGHERRDNLVGNAACVFALGVALFPVNSPHQIVHVAHLLAGAGLFLTLAYFSIALFTKSKEGVAPTPQKLKRNRVYTTCGWTMVGCTVGVGVYHLFLQDTAIVVFEPVFWLESVALWAFGWCWMIKGETLLKDD